MIRLRSGKGNLKHLSTSLTSLLKAKIHSTNFLLLRTFDVVGMVGTRRPLETKFKKVFYWRNCVGCDIFQFIVIVSGNMT